jgi:hypothetical protein
MGVFCSIEHSAKLVQKPVPQEGKCLSSRVAVSTALGNLRPGFTSWFPDGWQAEV